VAVIESTPATRVAVVHVACWPALTAAVVQPVMAVPFAEKLTVPPGATGVKATPARVAVKVTDVFKADGLAGEGAGVRVTAGLSLVMV
jgi:hypothetical protein